MKMLRSFNTIGQGAFYTETFYINGHSKHIVYDCGSSNGIKQVTKTVNSVFYEGEEVEAVFISHFDDDHINGLEYLLKHCKVKKLFIPLIRKENKALFLICFLLNKIPYSSFLYHFVEYPVKLISNKSSDKTQVIFIEEYEDENKNLKEDDNIYRIDGDTSTNQSDTLKSGTKIILSELKDVWAYIPYNFKENKRCEEFLKKLKDKNISYPDKDDVSSWFLNNKKKLTTIYKSLEGGINTNSMVVYSGPYDCRNYLHHEIINNQFRFCNCDFYYCKRKFSYKKVACLFTGDYNTKDEEEWKNLDKCFKNYWGIIGTIQIPHHGASSSYNTNLIKEGAEIAVISAGSNNRYKHPNPSVVRDIFFNDVKTYIVTEKESSQVSFKVFIGNK